MSNTSYPPTSSAAMQSSGNAHGLDNLATQEAAPSTQRNSLLDVPNAQQDASSSTGLSGATASDPTESVRRGSKRSLTGRRRAGSTTSSKRSQNAAATTAEKATTRPISASKQSQAPQPRAKKKSFLSFLNCCGAQDEGDDIGMQDAPQAAKEQPAHVQPSSAPVTQSTSVPETKEENMTSPLDEKTASPAYAETPEQSIASLTNEKTAIGMSQTDQRVGNATSESQAIAPTQIGGEESRREDQYTEENSHNTVPLAVATGVGAGAAALGAGALAESVVKSNPNVTIEAPTPVSPQSQEEQLISDRTPEQQARDTDIEMTDVGPSLPLSPNEVAGTAEDETSAVGPRDSTSQVDLPPPPPLEERQAQIAPAIGMATTSRDTSRQPSPGEPQKGLLPSMRPEHRGRKCLILDLDETLVHSSFKVSPSIVFGRPRTDLIQDSPPSRLYDTGRD